MKTLKSNISEACKVQVDCLKDSESDSYDQNDMKEKVNNLVRLHKAIQEKLKTAYIQNKSKYLTWYLINGLECTVPNYNVFESLVWTSREIIKVGGILAKPAPKKGKTITTETLRLVRNVYEDDNFIR